MVRAFMRIIHLFAVFLQVYIAERTVEICNIIVLL